ncbi:MAG: nucleoside hydrolase, partial [Novosphingobium sp.]
MRRIIGLFAALWLVAVLSCGPAHAEAARRKVIIDDEGFTLMHLMLLESDRIDVIGITSVSGNTWANRATAMALRGLEIAHRPDVPVVQGATYPLLNSEALTERFPAHKLFSLPRLGEQARIELGYRGGEDIAEPFEALLQGLREGGF